MTAAGFEPEPKKKLVHHLFVGRGGRETLRAKKKDEGWSLCVVSLKIDAS